MFLFSYGEWENVCKFFKIMRRFCFNRWFKVWLSKRVKIWKIRDLTRIVLAIAEYRINGTKWNWDSRKGIVQRFPMIPPCLIIKHGLPLLRFLNTFLCFIKCPHAVVLLVSCFLGLPVSEDGNPCFRLNIFLHYIKCTKNIIL